jgi:uncharacterized protein (TIGR03437 family)
MGLSSGSAGRGAPIALNIGLNNTGSAVPVAVQWTLNYSSLDFSSAAVTAGPVAIAANKSISCNNNAGATTCILWGLNATPISNGVLATVSLIVSSSTTNTSSAVQLGNTIAADGQGNAVATSWSGGGRVTIQQLANPALTLSSYPSSVVFQASAGSASTSQALSVKSSDNVSPLSFSVTPSDPSWIKLGQSAGTTPSTLNVGIDATTLSVGPHNGTITLACTGTTSCQSVILSVSATVTQTKLSVNTSSLSFQAYQGRSNPQSQTVMLSTTASTQLGFTVSGIPSWLQISPTSGMASATPLALTITATTGALNPGTNSGNINLIPANSSAPVTIAVSATLLPFSIQVTPNPPTTVNLRPGQAQTISLSVGTADNGSADLQIATSTNNTGNWLKVATNSFNAPGQLNVTLDASTLGAGNYSGTVTFSCAAVACTQVQIPINLAVSSTPNIAASFTSLSLQPGSGGSLPASQKITLSASDQSAQNFSFTYSPQGSWLKVTSDHNTTPAVLTVEVVSLPSQSSSGTITINPANGSPTVTIPVNLTLSVGSVPTIQTGGVITATAFGGFSTISPGTYIEIYGSNLAATSRTWASSDFTGANAPTAIDGVTVTINGHSAFVNYVSAGQVNVLVPGNVGTGGAALLTLSNSSGVTSPYPINVAPLQPGLLAPPSFVINGKQYVAALFPDGTFVMPTGALPGVASRPAKPGETITLYGIGFGPVIADTPVGTIAQQQNKLLAPLQVLFGQTSATLNYDGLAPTYVGLYQFNLVVPPVSDSDAVPLTFNLGGTAGLQTLYTAVSH